jgi:superfamily II DNA or RNA helicase
MGITVPIYELYPYQRKALGSVCKEFFDKEVYRQLVVLPTGMGKTVIFASAPGFNDIAQWLATYGTMQQKILVLAHRDELLKQARNKITAINPGLIVEIEQAEKKASPMCDIMIASVQTLKGKRLEKLDPRDYRIVITDEAHHSTSNSYTRIFQHFGFLPPDSWGKPKPSTSKANEMLAWQRERLGQWDQVADKDRLLIGFTATPRRSDNVGLEAVFQDVVFSKTIREGIEEKYLSPLRAIRVLSQVSLDAVKTTAGDFNQGQLEEAVNTEDRNKLAVKAWLEHARGRKTIAFTASVAHAEDLAREFRDADVKAVAVSGRTPEKEQVEILKRYRAGEIEVLANCQLYTEGFDEPNIECVLHTRPTKSSILYIQMTGRGTRKFPGKTDCLVIDVVDVTRRHSLLTAPELFGLPAGFDGKGEDLLDIAKKMDKAKQESPTLQTSDLRSLDELQMRIQEIDIWTSAIQSDIVENNARMSWLQDGETFRMNLPTRNYNNPEHIDLNQDALGHWQAKLHTGDTATTIATHPDIKQAFMSAEAWISSNKPHEAYINDRMAPWRNEQPSDAQVEHARRMRIPDTVIKNAKNKGELSDLINLAKSRQPAPQKPKFVL